MSRTDARSRSLRRRPSRVVPATVVAALLLALGTLTAIVAIARLVSGSWPTQAGDAAAVVAPLTWGSAEVISAGVLIALLGVVLLIAGVTPGGFRTAWLAAPDGVGADTGDTEFVISTEGLARLAVAHADTVDGVDGVSASASAGRVRVRVTTASKQADQIRARVQEFVAQGLADAGVDPVPKVTTTVRTKGI